VLAELVRVCDVEGDLDLSPRRNASSETGHGVGETELSESAGLEVVAERA
jgi:hypothetical protein